MDFLIDQYTGRLSNGGEELAVQLPEPYPFIICKFSFNDGWYSQTDGKGYPLELIDLSTDLASYNDRESWGVGSYLGSPHGTLLEESYKMWSDVEKTGTPNEDDDGDGLINALEYVFGGNPHEFDRIDSPRYVFEINAMEWEVSTRLAATDYRLIFEFSDDLKQWNELPSGQIVVESLSRKNVIYLPVSSGKKFLRLRIVNEFD
ncbi:MAG: hypothetical protein HRU47_11680 [Verrucomicrobiales bacterium]|nr:hypothetical protein [Verrucomicrobiales bacterium]